MKKKMLKPVSKIFALCIALSIFVCNGAIASAGCNVCNYYADGCHRYTKHEGTGEGYSEYGTHAHLTGYDANGEEVYQTCQWSAYNQYYVDKCECGAVQPGSRVLQRDYITHSVK